MTRVLCVCGLLAALAAGCGPKGVAVSGAVTRGGTPLSAGVVTLEPKPDSGTTGAGAWADVREGAFAIPAEKNLTPGTYIARVSPVVLGSGQDLKTAPPQFKPFETTVELKAGNEPLKIEMPAKD